MAGSRSRGLADLAPVTRPRRESREGEAALDTRPAALCRWDEASSEHVIAFHHPPTGKARVRHTPAAPLSAPDAAHATTSRRTPPPPPSASLSERALHSNSLSIPTRSPSLATVVFQPGRGSVARRHPAPTRRPVTTYSARRIPQDCYAREGAGWRCGAEGGWGGWGGVALCSQTPCSRADEPRAEAKTWGRSHACRASKPSERSLRLREYVALYSRVSHRPARARSRVFAHCRAERFCARVFHDQIVCAWARARSDVVVWTLSSEVSQT